MTRTCPKCGPAGFTKSTALSIGDLDYAAERHHDETGEGVRIPTWECGCCGTHTPRRIRRTKGQIALAKWRARRASR